MKKILFGLFLFAAVSLFSCKESKGAYEGIVGNITDTTLTVTSQDDSIVFSTVKAIFSNGVCIVGDTVRVDFRGHDQYGLPSAHAIYTYPKKGNFTDGVYDSTKVLLTAPATKEQEEELEKFSDEAKKHGH